MLSKLKHYFGIYCVNIYVMTLYYWILLFLFKPPLDHFKHLGDNLYLILALQVVLYSIPAFIMGWLLDKERRTLISYTVVILSVLIGTSVVDLFMEGLDFNKFLIGQFHFLSIAYKTILSVWIFTRP